MRGGAESPMALPSLATSAGDAPTTAAILSTGTRGQLRQTKACSRSGKCGRATGAGLGPFGKSAAEKVLVGRELPPGWRGCRTPVVEQPSTRLPANRPVPLRKSRRRIGVLGFRVSIFAFRFSPWQRSRNDEIAQSKNMIRGQSFPLILLL